MSKPLPQCGHVRFSTLPFAEGAFSRISSNIALFALWVGCFSTSLVRRRNNTPRTRRALIRSVFYPVPYCPNAFLFRYNVKHERVCLNTIRAHSKTEQYPYSPRTLFSGVLDIKLILVRRRNNAPLSQTCKRGRAFAHACKSRRVPTSYTTHTYSERSRNRRRPCECRALDE